ncbi:hypothetical protein POL58_45955 [Nannocystis sp. ncelm1]|uniref:Uncharacterized protein n=1 Tax=Nannocystis radixulma TaxID=2995305 RepID=A0ABT5BLX8_9BACT|nr:hypothetical protein [Nannocystis radixulma]
MTPRELAELLWMGARLGTMVVETATTTTGGGATPAVTAPPVSMPTPAPHEAADVSLDDADEATATATAPAPASSPATRLRGRVARPAPLEDRLRWSRALHRLGTCDAVGLPEVDGPATVQQSARIDDLQLVFRPRGEPVTSLVILEDCAGQVAPWQRMIGALVRLARGAVGFTQVRHLRVDLSDPGVATAEHSDAATLQRALAAMGQPGYPLLVVVVSDGLAPGLARGALAHALARLSVTASVAWMHPWGDAHWSATPALGTLARGRPRPLQPRDRRPLQAALVPLSPTGLTALGEWAHGRNTPGLVGVRLPPPSQRVGNRRPPSPAARRPIDWEEHGRQLACVLESETQQLLALAAGVPGCVDLDLLSAFAENSAGPEPLATRRLSRFHLAQALASGLLERDRSRAGLVVRFADDDTSATPARTVALRWLDSEQARGLIAFLAEHLRDGPTRAEQLGIPYALLLHLWQPDAMTLDAEVKLSAVQRSTLRSVLDLAGLKVSPAVRAALAGSSLPAPPTGVAAEATALAVEQIQRRLFAWLGQRPAAFMAEIERAAVHLDLRVRDAADRVEALRCLNVTIDADEPDELEVTRFADDVGWVTVKVAGTATLRGDFDRADVNNVVTDDEGEIGYDPTFYHYTADMVITWLAELSLKIGQAPDAFELESLRSFTAQPEVFDFEQLSIVDTDHPSRPTEHHVVDWLRRKRAGLEEMIWEALHDSAFTVDQAEDDVEVEQVDVRELEFHEVEFENGGAIVATSGTGVVRGSFIRPDYDHATWDKEDQEWYNLHRNRITARFLVDWSARIELEIDDDGAVRGLPERLALEILPTDFEFEELEILATERVKTPLEQLRAYATEYERIRREMGPGRDRTSLLDRLFEQMAAVPGISQEDALTLFNSRSAGARVAALAVCTAQKARWAGPLLKRAIQMPLSQFEDYQALRGIRSLWHVLTEPSLRGIARIVSQRLVKRVEANDAPIWMLTREIATRARKVPLANEILVEMPNDAYLRIDLTHLTTFGALTDEVYSALGETELRPYRYGEDWWLIFRGKKLLHRRNIEGLGYGKPVPDGRSLLSLGIKPGSILTMTLRPGE